MPLKAVLIREEWVWLDEARYVVTRRLANGLVLAQLGASHLAASRVHTMPGSLSLRPVIGHWTLKGERWMLGRGDEVRSLQAWLEALNMPRMELERLLAGKVQQEKFVKVSIERWSLDDLQALIKAGYLVGFSKAAPWWRVYALLPSPGWHRRSFTGKVKRMTRFGPILQLRDLQRL